MAVELMIGSQIWGGWESVAVTRSMEHVSGTFDLALYDRGPDSDMRRDFVPGEGCQVRIDTEAVVTGYIDDFAVSYSDRDHSLQVNGRDRTGDLVDCSPLGDPGEWADAGLQDIAADLCRPFGIAVTAADDTGARFPKFKIQEGDTVFETIERACRQRRILPTTNGAGNLVLTRAGAARCQTVLRYGENILSGNGSFSMADRFGRYVIKGQQPSFGDTNDAEATTAVTAEASDGGVRRHRPLVIIADSAGNEAAAQERVNWEASVRAARARRITYAVAGHREYENGPLWVPNRLVRVEDPLMGFSGDLLIASVTYKISEQGSITDLSLVLPGSFDGPPTAVAKDSDTGDLSWIL